VFLFPQVIAQTEEMVKGGVLGETSWEARRPGNSEAEEGRGQ